MDQAVIDKLGPAKPGFEWTERPYDGQSRDGDVAFIPVTMVWGRPRTIKEDMLNKEVINHMPTTHPIYRQEPVKKISGSGTLRFNDRGWMQGLPVADGLGIGVNNAKNKTFRITYEEV